MNSTEKALLKALCHYVVDNQLQAFVNDLTSKIPGLSGTIVAEMASLYLPTAIKELDAKIDATFV